MPQDAFNLRRCAEELNTFLSGGKINRIIQPEKDELVFNVFTGKTVLRLALSASAAYARVCVTQKDKQSPLVAPNFCMLLRKHLLGGEILSVEQVGFERIIAIKIKCVSDFTSAERVLYAEIMGKYSNLILTENGIILGALKTPTLEENARRLLMSGAKYALPDPQDKLCPLEGEKKIAALMQNCDGDRAEFIFNHISGLAIQTARRIEESYVDGTPFSEHLYSYIFEGESSPCVIFDGAIPSDFSAKAVKGGVPFSTLNEAEDFYFTKKEELKDFEGKKRKLKAAASSALKKQEKSLSLSLEKQKECLGLEENKLKGELITSYMYMIKTGAEGCSLVNYYDPEGKEIKISLDKNLTPAQNAQKYYKKYNKQKRTLAAIEPRIKDERAEIDYLNGVISFIDGAEEISDLQETEDELISLALIKAPQTKKKKEVVIPFRTFEFNGFKIISGRNNVQNDRLLKALSPADIWLHTQKYHSSHVGIITDGKEATADVIEYAARLCAYYSEAKGEKKVPVDYCQRKFVKKPPRAKAGFVVYTDYKTILVEATLPSK